MIQQHQVWGWDYTLKIPQSVKDQVLDLNQFLQPGIGRSFLTQPQRVLYSDSSQNTSGARKDVRSHGDGVLERSRHPPHQSEGVSRSRGYHEVSGQAKGNRHSARGQPGHVQLFTQMGKTEKTISTTFYAPSSTGASKKGLPSR